MYTNSQIYRGHTRRELTEKEKRAGLISVILLGLVLGAILTVLGPATFLAGLIILMLIGGGLLGAGMGWLIGSCLAASSVALARELHQVRGELEQWRELNEELWQQQRHELLLRVLAAIPVQQQRTLLPASVLEADGEQWCGRAGG